MASNSSKSVYLDIDSSIVEDNLRFLKNSDEEELNKLFGGPSQTCPSKVVQPKPGFCVKTREIGNDTKVFVNICQTDAIPPPKDITESELSEIIESESASDFRVPMSIGEIRPEKDKQGVESKAVDIAIHPSFFNKITESSDFKNFFMAVVFQGLENKYGLICVDKKIIMKNRKAFGTLQMHRMQQREMDEKMGKTNREKSMIEEITGQSEKRNKVVIETLQNTKIPEYRLYKKKEGGNKLYGEFRLPDVLSAKELTLDIGEDRILLESKSRGYLLDIFIPYIIRQESCSSVFEKTTKVLTVTMPLVGG